MMNLRVVVKARERLRWEEIAELLKEALLKAFDQRSRDVLLDMLTYVRSRGEDGLFDINDMRYVEERVRRYFGAGLVDLAERAVIQATMDSYMWGKKQVHVGLSMSQRDQDAIRVIGEYKTFWLKKRQDEFVDNVFRDVIRGMMEEGITRREAVHLLEERLPQIGEERAAYWDTVVRHWESMTQNLGRVSGYEEAGVEYVKVVAVLDSRTTLICRRMHGRIIPVKVLREQRDRILQQLRRKAKHVGFFLDEPKGFATKDLIRQGAGLPPYHFGCRTTTVAFFSAKKPKWAEELERGEHAEHFAGLRWEEVQAFHESVVDLARRAELGFLHRRSLRMHFRKLFEKHVSEGYRDEEDYLEQARQTVYHAKEVVFVRYRYRKHDELQLWYFDGERVTVVNMDRYIRTHFGNVEGKAWRERVRSVPHVTILP